MRDVEVELEMVELKWASTVVYVCVTPRFHFAGIVLDEQQPTSGDLVAITSIKWKLFWPSSD